MPQRRNRYSRYDNLRNKQDDLDDDFIEEEWQFVGDRDDDTDEDDDLNFDVRPNVDWYATEDDEDDEDDDEDYEDEDYENADDDADDSAFKWDSDEDDEDYEDDDDPEYTESFDVDD